jgi:regulator of protease activity HflC (stomatin/prohibitin superfamily)
MARRWAMSGDGGSVKETLRTGNGGGGMLGLLILLLLGSIAGAVGGGIWADKTNSVAIGLATVVPSGLLFLVAMVGLGGLIVVEPNEAKVLLLFGRYKGTVKEDGWWWVNPFMTKKKISLRVVNFETGRLKVNDLDGNPIEIASIVVWRVVDTAEASFAVEDYADYVKVQCESALRNLATQYTYDTHDDDKVSLRGHTGIVAQKLREEIQERLDRAGVEVLEARISHLAYAPEIAEAMLRRQQAGAIIAARQKIVDGAVGMVQMALEQLARNKVVELDDERKASMVSNLLVVLCADQPATPVVNAGTLYS